MKKIYRLQSIINLAVGIGALFGGAMAVTDPYGVQFGMPVDVLKKGPFTTFLIPGLFLFSVIGLGHLLSFAAAWRKFRLQPYIGGGVGCILMAWIVIQCYILESIHFLHVTFFILGLAESLIALYLLVKAGLFPFSRKPFDSH